MCRLYTHEYILHAYTTYTYMPTHTLTPMTHTLVYQMANPGELCPARHRHTNMHTYQMVNPLEEINPAEDVNGTDMSASGQLSRNTSSTQDDDKMFEQVRAIAQAKLVSV